MEAEEITQDREKWKNVTTNKVYNLEKWEQESGNVREAATQRIQIEKHPVEEEDSVRCMA